MRYKKIKGSIVIISFLVISIFLFSIFRSKEQIKIGFVAGLTGTGSQIGVDGRNGVLLAVEEVNQSGGIKGQQVELLIGDDKNDPTVALKVDQQLVEQGTRFIIGHMNSDMTKFTVPFVNEKQILMISPTISLDSLAGIDDNFLRVIPLQQYQGRFLADAAYYEKNIKKMAIIYDKRNHSFAEGIMSSFEKKIQSYGGEIIAKEFFDADNRVNYLEIVTRIRQTNAEGILIIASSINAAMFCQHLFKEKISLPIFMPMWPMTQDLIKQGGPAVEGVYLVSHMDIHSMATEYREFEEKYYKKYESQPSFASLFSYEAAKILFESIKQAKQFTVPAIKETILYRKTFNGLQHEIVIDQYGDAVRKEYLYRVENGVFVKVEK